MAFELDGQKFTVNGGPRFKFTEAVSFVVRCETQQDVDQMRRGGLPAAVARSPAA